MKKVIKNEKEITLRDLAKLISGVSTDLNNLAISTAEGFSEMNGKFEQVDLRFEQIDLHFDRIGKELDIIKTDVAVIKTDLRTLDDKIGFISKSNKEDINALASNLVRPKNQIPS
jgi:hypothetical protein